MVETAAARVAWRSPLGIASALFLAWGVLNALLAVAVPASLLGGGAGATGALVLTPETDAVLLGRTLADIGRDDPRLDAYLVSFMLTMCAQMMAYAILDLGLAWFALRRAQGWALWVLSGAALASFLYFVPVILEYARFGVAVEGAVPLIAIPVPVVLAVTVLGWYGLRRAGHARPAAAEAPGGA